MENDKIIFRTPEIPKNRRRKSLPYKIDGEHQASPLSSLSASYSFAYGSGSSLNSSANESTSMYDTSLNSSIDDYLEIENITRSLDLTTLTFDDEKRQKQKQKETRFNEMCGQNAQLTNRVSNLLKESNKDAKTVLTIFQQLLDDDVTSPEADSVTPKK